MNQNEYIEKQVSDLIKTGTQIYNGAIDEAISKVRSELVLPEIDEEDKIINLTVHCCISKLLQLKKM